MITQNKLKTVRQQIILCAVLMEIKKALEGTEYKDETLFQMGELIGNIMFRELNNYHADDRSEILKSFAGPLSEILAEIRQSFPEPPIANETRSIQ